MNQGEGEVLVKEEAQELAHADIGPAAVHQQEALEVAELSESVVTGHHCLHAFLPTDAHANICSCAVGKQKRKVVFYMISFLWHGSDLVLTFRSSSLPLATHSLSC